MRKHPPKPFVCWAVTTLLLAFACTLQAADPGLSPGYYTFRETWTYKKSYSGLGRVLVRKEKDGRVLVIDRASKEIDWVFYPSGKVVFNRDDTPKPWTGRWKRKGSALSVTAASGRQSGSAVFTRTNAREWRMRGVHKVNGKQIGVGSGVLKRTP